MKIKNVIFDVGNVIVRWSPLHIIESTFPDHGPDQHQFYIEEIFRSDTWIQLNLGQIDEMDAKLKFTSKIASFDSENADTLFNFIKSTQELIPGTVDIIKSLHEKGYQLFALTDNIKEIVQYLQNRYDFWKYFTHVTVSANLGLMKPNKEIFEYTLQENDLLPHETLFIDDHLPNVKAAEALDLHTILFSDSTSCLQQLDRLGVYVND
ncbi:HAD family hydrolase [Legionella hackeliae]|uniref:HAD family hydrolase n=1 Tax=Legionella hackeliae TaxID=449 RepID=UPI00072F0EB0|nr:HAD family phosphatase [Legionella hackeliae]KTD12284.1 Alpha-D-glucose-1-phosphate phosphatase YihX [Legionella hackeliae]